MMDFQKEKIVDCVNLLTTGKSSNHYLDKAAAIEILRDYYMNLNIEDKFEEFTVKNLIVCLFKNIRDENKISKQVKQIQSLQKKNTHLEKELDKKDKLLELASIDMEKRLNGNSTTKRLPGRPKKEK